MTLLPESFFFVFYFRLDSIVEATEGAVGKLTVKNLKHPFMMLGGAEEIKGSLDCSHLWMEKAK